MPTHPGKLWPLALLALLCAAPSCGDAPATTPAAAPLPPAAAELVEALQDAHGQLKPALGPARVKAQQEALAQEKTFPAPLAAFYAKAPGCALVCNGDLTLAGRATLRWLTRLEDHGVNPSPYDLPALKDQLATWRAATHSAQHLPRTDAELPQGVVLDALRDPSFDPQRVGRRVPADRPALQEVARLKEALQGAPKGEDLQRQEGELEVMLGRALLRAVLDLKLAKRAGPHDVTPDDGALAQQQQGPLVEAMLSVVASDQPDQAIEALWPSEPEYRKLVEQRRRYLKLAEPGCGELAEPLLEPVAPSPAVKRLGERLACEGYLAAPFTGESYDDALKQAVARFQRLHALEETGYVGPETLKALNVPMVRRAEQLGLALQRLREQPLGLPPQGPAVVVNLPAFELRIVEGGQVARRHRAIIGSNKMDDDKVELLQGHINRTKLLRTRLYEVILNPEWLMPARVVQGELQGFMEKNPSYLEDNNIRRTTLAKGQEGFVQGPGKGNALGKVKFLLEASSAIYLHDTNEPKLFRKSQRAFSHGCIRVEEAAALAEWLLLQDGQDKAQVQKALDARKVQYSFPLKAPLPVVFVYRTVEIGEDDLPIFYSDVYQYDKAYSDKALPVKETSWWGDSKLRPRWVPLMDYEEVKRWKAEGKVAPRDLKPDDGDDRETPELPSPAKKAPKKPR